MEPNLEERPPDSTPEYGEPDPRTEGAGVDGDGGGQWTEVGRPYDGEGGVRRGVEREVHRDKSIPEEQDELTFEPPD